MAASSSMPTSSVPHVDRLEPPVRRALDQAIDHVRRFAETQRPSSTRTTIAPGIEIERRWNPLASVGAYVPGGSAPYPSSLVMTVVPARVAGVERDRRRLPRRCDRDDPPGPARGRRPPRGRCLHRRRRRAGDRCPRLRAPGRRHRARRSDRRSGQRLGDRRQDRGLRRGRHRPAGRPVGGDGPGRAAGRRSPRRRRPHHPGRARPGFAGHPRHDRRRPSRTPSRQPSRPSSRAPPATTSSTPRSATTAGSSLAPDLDAAIDFVNAYGPEHLSVDIEPLEPTVARLRNAGSLFVGPWAPESAGDYATGANHVLPTGGLARASGPLSVETYGKFSQVQRIDRDGLASIRETIGTLAGAEGLLAHRDAVEIRFEEEPGTMSPTPVTFSSPTAPASYSLGGDRRAGRRPVRRRPGRRSSAST